jgi:hypothetical protein
MYCFFKNCYCIWSISLGGYPLEEASEHISLLLSLFSLVFLRFFTTFHVISLKFWVTYTTLVTQIRS